MLTPPLRYADRLAARIEALPPSIRPAVFGVFVILLFAGLRGAWLVLPIAIVYEFATNAHPWAALATGAGVAGLALLGAAISGLAYGVVGRHLRAAMPGGYYLAGVLTMAPYMFLLNYVVRLGDGDPFWRPLDRLDVIFSAGMTLLFGAFIGRAWFGPDNRKLPPRRRQPNDR